MNGVRVIDKKRYIKGSAAVEAAIALPVFLIVMFSLALIIRIFFIYNTVQASLSEVARRIGNMSYFYHVSGLKELSDSLDNSGDEAETELGDQKDIIVNAFESFTSVISHAEDSVASGTIDGINSLLASAGEFDQDMEAVDQLINTVLDDPKSELMLVSRIFAKKLSYEVTKGLVCTVAKASLGSDLRRRLGGGSRDAALQLGIKDGLKGMDFSNSSVFGDKESLEFVVHYNVKTPAPFNIIPKIKLSNRVKVIAWTGGRGKSVKLKNQTESSRDESQDSIWTSMDQDNRYWDRGLEIEELQVAEIFKNSSPGVQCFNTENGYPVIDAFTYDPQKCIAEYYDVFTLNPFLKTYSERHSAIRYEIKKHGKRLLECDPPEALMDKDIKEIKRIVVIVMPEGSPSYANEEYQRASQELKAFGVEVRCVFGYGAYIPPGETYQGAA